MCGICGILNFDYVPVDRNNLQAMNKLLRHRGPDGEGYFWGNNIAFGMRRFAIIDAIKGMQPVYNEDKSIVVVCNGEIYNFAELRKELGEKKHKFISSSDIEVLPHLYEEYGEDFPKMLRGMFAIALYDISRQTLLLVRDRIGKKPLYYFLDDKKIVFSSEMQSLCACVQVNKEINLEVINLFLSLQCVPAPISVFKQINKLQAASMLKIKVNDGLSSAKLKKYWQLPDTADIGKITYEEAKEKIAEIITDAVKIRMRADVPIGAFLSGGIDSSIIVALMAKNSSKPIKTFSIGFNEKDFSELPYAEAISKKYGTNHSEFIVDESMAEDIENIAANYGEPFADTSMLPTYFLCKETKKDVTVAFTGDGGDELFGGYNRYRAMLIEQKFFSLLPSSLKKSALSLLSYLPKEAPFGFFWKLEKFLRISCQSGLAEKYLYSRSFINSQELSELATKKFLSNINLSATRQYALDLFSLSACIDTLNQMIRADFNSWLPDCLMPKMDISSMYNSLEARSPFLDHKLVEFAYKLPTEMKISGYSEAGMKKILRDTFSYLLPQEIKNRGKRGFSIPIGRWFRGNLKKFWYENCMNEAAMSRGIFQKEALERLISEHCSGKKDNGYKLWTVLMLELWFKRYANDFKL